MTPAQSARDARGLSLESAAKRLRISPRTLSRYESGRGASLYLAKRIARLYGTSAFGSFCEQGVAVSKWNAELRRYGLA